MNTLETILILAVVIAVLGVFFYVFIPKIKKVKNKEKEETKEKPTIEQAIKTDRKEEKVEEKKEEQPKVEMPKEEISLKALRKQSEVKIIKKALKADSRNPSISKVFGKDSKDENNNKKIDEKNEDNKKEQEFDEDEETNERVLAKSLERESSPLRAFGFREPAIEKTSQDEKEFKFETEQGERNIAPRLTDRTNFGEHLNVSEDNNLSGVMGTGIKSAIERADETEKKSLSRAEELFEKIKDLDDDEIDEDFMMFKRPYEKNENGNIKKNLDLKTIILADAINNPKSKKNNRE